MSLTSKGHFKIGNTEFVAQDISWAYDSLATEDSGRTDDGVQHITWVKQKLAKVTVTLPPSTAADVSAVLNLVQGQIYTFTWWDVLSNSEKSFTAYTSNAAGDVYSGVVYNGLYQNVKFSAIDTGA